jgi:hypothetical protein
LPGVLDTVYDDPEKLLAVVGSFWRNVYEGSFTVGSILHARAQIDADAHLRLLALVAAMSRFEVPVFHRRNWTLLRVLESRKNETEVARFDGSLAFTDGSPAAYDVPRAGELHAWAVPAELAAAKTILNRITDASLVLAEGVDFTLADGVVLFRADPFADDRVAKREVVQDGTVVDREAALWVYGGEWDWDTVYEQFGYALGLKLKSSEGYRDLVNAVFDALVVGPVAASVEAAFSAVCGIPLANGDETVEEIWRDAEHLWVSTDASAYKFAATAVPTVAVGQLVGAGRPLVRGLRFFDLNRGHAALADGLRALVLGRGVLAAGFYQELLFEDTEVPLVVTYDAADRAKVSWELPGFPGDVTMFFDTLHAAGVAAGQTLAQLLDTRPAEAKATNPEPPPAALPPTINPLAVLCDNVLRNNAFVVHLRPAEFGPAALGLGAVAQILRRIVPPWTLCLVVAELSGADAPVRMTGPGTDESPGYVEAVATFSAARTAEDCDVALVAETVRARQIVGRCE